MESVKKVAVGCPDLAVTHEDSKLSKSTLKIEDWTRRICVKIRECGKFERFSKVDLRHWVDVWVGENFVEMCREDNVCLEYYVVSDLADASIEAFGGESSTGVSSKRCARNGDSVNEQGISNG